MTGLRFILDKQRWIVYILAAMIRVSPSSYLSVTCNVNFAYTADVTVTSEASIQVAGADETARFSNLYNRSLYLF